MANNEPVYIAGAFEHPTREAPETSTLQLHAEVARGALDDAGLSKDDVDGYLTANVPENQHGFGSLIMTDYLNLDVSFADTTDHGGASYVSHVGHATQAIRDGKCDVALITLAGRPRSRAQETGTGVRNFTSIQDDFELTYAFAPIAKHAMVARRHMHEFGTTSEQLAEVRVAAAHHAQFNEHAKYSEPVTVEDVLGSRMVSDPFHILDCCMISDGGGALVLVSEDVKKELDRECVEIAGHGEHIGHSNVGRPDFAYSGARQSGELAYDEAGVGPEDIDYASLYDAFTITVLYFLEDLGFCEKGEAGSFVEDGALKAPNGALPVNTDGGSLCSNHPNRGGITKVIEGVRQLRGETNPEVQVDSPEYALVQAAGGSDIGTRHAAVTMILSAEGVA